jgi:hypothetical protein
VKILAVAAFDCGGVHSRHRAVLRELGVDYRMATKVQLPGFPETLQAEWRDGPRCDYASLAAFAAEADVIQFHPGIGTGLDDGWELSPEIVMATDADRVPFGPVDWQDPRFRRARRIAHFYGSVATNANMAAYADMYRKRGMEIWGSMISYTVEVGATYNPQMVDLERYGAAPLRGDDDPLIVVHNPTNAAICHSAEIETVCGALGILLDYPKRYIQHEAVLQRKLGANVGFDHLRTGFSINSLENAALGLVNLVGGTAAGYAAVTKEVGAVPPWPFIPAGDVDRLRGWLRELERNPARTRTYQLAGRAYVGPGGPFHRLSLGKRLKAQYEAIL